jgi:hypothetical protein
MGVVWMTQDAGAALSHCTLVDLGAFTQRLSMHGTHGQFQLDGPMNAELGWPD